MKKRGRKTKTKSVPFLRSKAWKQLRLEVLERDGHTCCLCGSGEKLNCHHMLYRKFYKELQLEPDCVITVCDKCHFEIHKGVGNFRLLEWLRENRPEQYAWVVSHVKKAENRVAKDTQRCITANKTRP